MAFRLETERLILRDWRVGDPAEIDAMHVLGTDPKVMETLGPLMTREETAGLIERLGAVMERQGRTFWALERKADGRLIGFTGMIRSQVPVIEDKLEIGWRLAFDAWGQGYATEAARACIADAARTDPGEPIYAITSVTNVRSRAVMERIGMVRVPDMDFDHPRIPAGAPLAPHVTYRLVAD